MTDESVLDMRIAGVGEAAARARVAFFIMLFACGAIICAVYSNYFTWNRIIFEPKQGLTELPPPAPLKPAANLPVGATDLGRKYRTDSIAFARKKQSDENSDEERKQTARAMADYEDITISWLGIKISSADADILATLGLFFVAMWFLLCVRRLSLETVSLIHDVTGPRRAGSAEVVNREIALIRSRAVYYGLRQSFVLSSTPIEDIESTPTTLLHESDRSLRFLGRLFPTLTFLPTITVAFCLLSDLYYITLNHSSDYPDWRWWYLHLSPEFKIQLWIMEGFALLIGLAIWRMNLTSYRLDKQSATTVADFARRLRADQPIASPAGALATPFSSVAPLGRSEEKASLN